MASIEITDAETLNVSIQEESTLLTNVSPASAVKVKSTDGWYEKEYQETDPLFSASPAAEITSADITNWNNKISDRNYVHNQTEAADTWIITHNLDKYPSVTVFDSAGEEVIGEVKYNSSNQITITFAGAFKGTATLN